MAADPGRPTLLPRILRGSLALILVAAVVAGCAPDGDGARAVPVNKAAGPVCGLWYAIGSSPAPDMIATAVRHNSVIVLNAWEQATMRRIKALDPSVKVLVYKDLSSTRSYAGAYDGGKDARFLPAGVGYGYAQRTHPEWFATDTVGGRIEWNAAYPHHWQMAVWNVAYQRYWTEQVTREVLAQGWDGVLADNDFAQLYHYSPKLLRGTTSPDHTNRKLRDGLDRLVTMAGSRLAGAGKLFVPNIAEARLTPGRWTSHSRFGGGMEEGLAYPIPEGLMPFGYSQWNEMSQTAARGAKLVLLITQPRLPNSNPTGFASAALLSGSKTCWMSGDSYNYRKPTRTALQDLDLGRALGPATRRADGVWTRRFAHGIAVVNPTTLPRPLSLPKGTRTASGGQAPAMLAPVSGDIYMLP